MTAGAAKKNRTALDTAAVAAGRANQAPDEARSPGATGAVSGASRQFPVVYIVEVRGVVSLRVLTRGGENFSWVVDEVILARLAAEVTAAQFTLLQRKACQ